MAHQQTDFTPPGAESGSQAGNLPRPLACALCQHRKVKCDRKSPCSNCVKANVTCIPSTPAPPRKRRRPNQDLRERLDRCEELLKYYSNRDAAAGITEQPGSSAQQAPAASSGTQSSSEPSVTYSATGEPTDRPPAGKMIPQGGGARFMDSQVWTSFYDELRAIKDIVDHDDNDEVSMAGIDEVMPDLDADFSLTNVFSKLDLADITLEPVLAFRLWHTYLERVNPLTKVLHAPSVQPYVVQAAGDMSQVPLSYQALLYTIYLTATVALSDDECLQTLSMSRRDALAKFTAGARKALAELDFMRNYDMTILQALLLYIQSLQGRYDRHASWIMSGTVLRIAVKMGYHRDGESLKLSTFETEMRRRIWWQIMMQDSKLAQISGLSQSMDFSSFDTKVPSNFNDADLFPESTEVATPREGPTEMAFCLMFHEVNKQFVVSSALKDELEAALFAGAADDKQPAVDWEKQRAAVQKLSDDLKSIEDRYVDASAGLAHRAALMIRPLMVSRLAAMLLPMREQPEWGTEIFSQKDNLFKIVVASNEHTFDMYDAMGEWGFLWFCKTHFELDIVKLMTGQLYQRPMGSLADRGWKALERVYHYHTELLDMSNRQYAAQAQFTIKAWQAREAAHASSGRPVAQVPEVIAKLKEALRANGLRTGSPSSAPLTPPQPGEAPSLAMMDQSVDEYLTIPTDGSWDMWRVWSEDPILGNTQNL